MILEEKDQKVNIFVRHDSTMMTSKLTGAFMHDAATRDEFYRFIQNLKK